MHIRTNNQTDSSLNFSLLFRAPLTSLCPDQNVLKPKHPDNKSDALLHELTSSTEKNESGKADNNFTYKIIRSMNKNIFNIYFRNNSTSRKQHK